MGQVTDASANWNTTGGKAPEGGNSDALNEAASSAAQESKGIEGSTEGTSVATGENEQTAEEAAKKAEDGNVADGASEQPEAA